MPNIKDGWLILSLLTGSSTHRFIEKDAKTDAPTTFGLLAAVNLFLSHKIVCTMGYHIPVDLRSVYWYVP